VDVGENTTGRNGDAAKELVQLFVVLDSKSDVAGHNTTLLVVTGSIASELKDFSAKVLEDGRKIHGGSGTHARGVLAITKVTANTTNGELKASLGGGGSRLLFAASSLSFSFAGHVDEFEVVESERMKNSKIMHTEKPSKKQKTVSPDVVVKGFQYSSYVNLRRATVRKTSDRRT
jgi:hypothetical protein